MKLAPFALCASLAFAGFPYDASSQIAPDRARAKVGVKAQAQAQPQPQSQPLAQYEAIGGGSYWHFKLINNGTGFSIEYVGTGASSTVVETGSVTSQTDLSGGNWLIQGMAGNKPITVLIERRGPLQCNDGYYGGRDDVRVAWEGALYKGCGPYQQ